MNGWLIGLVLGFVGGCVATLFLRRWIASRKLREAEEEAQRILNKAIEEQKKTLLQAKEEAINIKSAAGSEYREHHAELQRQEKRLAQKEENLDRKLESFERREQSIASREKETERVKNQVEELRNKEFQRLEQVAGMSFVEAKELLLQRVDVEIRDEAVQRLHRMEAEVREEAQKKARQLIAEVMQRCTTEVVTESTVSVVALPSDDMKGRLIGREGRNIRALEHASGVELIVDDTPETVTLSCFDPVRREVARLALTKLLLDGRIHPARIEEMVQKAKNEVDTTIKAEGEQAAFKAGVPGLHPELIKVLGRLKYRTSYGQNVLVHSIETAILAGMLAAELGAKVDVAKRAGLLHDIGKALDFEMEGPHALTGANIVKQWDKSAEVARCVAEHHEDVEFSSVEGFIVATADAISGARPGARRESLEEYLRRLENLESIANDFTGVEKSYATQAGREVRIMVKPDDIDDLDAMRLARDIAKRIEESLNYPGQIKVTVIRETRATEFAK
ncbi:MAG: ribonuclease Y [Chloroflexota bacterium]|nr:ribonuclease Y [Chloroflexota bacterium]